jgi:hypothetical protein
MPCSVVVIYRPREGTGCLQLIVQMAAKNVVHVLFIMSDYSTATPSLLC